MKYLISIIVPIYKVEPYLRRCLDSIINQTYTNLEIILVDDGSPDGCPQICDEYAAKDERIVVIHKENGGLSDARNAGIKKATAEYIFFLDGDDSIETDCIELLLSSISEHPNVDIVVGEMQSFPKTSLYKNNRIKKINFLKNNLNIRLNFFRTNNRIPINACNKLIRKEFILNNNLFFKPNLIHEDELWMFHVVLKTESICFVHKATYCRFINPNSITTSTNIQKKTNAWGIILEEMLENISSPAYKQQLIYVLNLLRYNYNPEYESKRFAKIWNTSLLQLKKHHLWSLFILYYIYKSSYPLLRGHGIGFLIWVMTK